MAQLIGVDSGKGGGEKRGKVRMSTYGMFFIKGGREIG